MSYTIKIVNNEDGKVVIDENNALAIIGGIGVEKGEHVIGITECHTIKIAGTVHAANKAISMIKESSPGVKEILALASLKDLVKSLDNLTDSEE